MSTDRDLTSIWEARRLVRRSAVAQREIERFDQKQVDAVIDAMAATAAGRSKRLAEMACRETGFGNVRDKETKNAVAYKHVYEYIRPMRTVGILSRDRDNTIVEIASPVGVVAAIIPSTNPTSTTIYKILIAIKARNSIVISPHPNARECIAETARIMDEAGRAAGLPPDAILCMSEVTLEGTQELMRAKETSVVLATGSMGLVKAAYGSGKPAYGVGPGNVPAYVHSSADLGRAANDIIAGKSFDYGTICASEQNVVADADIAAKLREEMAQRGAYFLSPEEAAKVAAVLVTGGKRPAVNPELVGKSPSVIAKTAGVSVPEKTRCLVAELVEVGPQEPLSIEKLSPVLGFYTVADWREGCERCKQILAFGGMGHTLAIHAGDEDVILAFGLEKPAYRICVNTPATHGAVGYSTALPPSLTLGCGAAGNNITSDNITPLHLMDIKRVAYGKREVPLSEIGPDAPPVKQETLKSAQASTNLDKRDIERLVDNFIGSRKPRSAVQPLNPAKQKNAPPEPPKVAAPAPIPKVAPQPRQKPPEPKPVDFVCEYDVRTALERGEQIPVGSSTIITPAARELGEQQSIFLYIDGGK